MVFFQEIIYLNKIKDGAYVIILDEYADVGTDWIALFRNRNEIVSFDSFVVEHIPEETEEFIDCHSLNSSASQNKNTKANIFRVQANDSVMYGLFCIGFIDFMLAFKNWLIIQFFFLHMILRKTRI